MESSDKNVLDLTETLEVAQDGSSDESLKPRKRPNETTSEPLLKKPRLSESDPPAEEKPSRKRPNEATFEPLVKKPRLSEPEPPAEEGSSEGTAEETSKPSRKRPKPDATESSTSGPLSKKPRLSESEPSVQEEPTAEGSREVGHVLVMGRGYFGQLGLGDDANKMERKKPTAVMGLNRIVEIAAGGVHSVCLTENGEVYTFGCNDEGALGHDDDEYLPGLVDIPGKVVQVSAGDSHSAALTDDGKVFLWGNFKDSHGQLGLTLEGSHRKPVQVMKEFSAMRISSGADHCVILTTEGQVYTCGNSEQGSLGRIEQELTIEEESSELKDLQLTPSKIMFDQDPQMDCTWCGEFSSFMRTKKDGEIFVTGLNNYHQLGSRDPPMFFHPSAETCFRGHKWLQISGGRHHTVALDDQGQVYTLGLPTYGALGLGSTPDVGETVWEPTPVPTLEGIRCIEVSAGDGVSLAVADNGDLYAWGSGTNLQLGRTEEVHLNKPDVVKGKQLQGCRVISVSCGGTHVIMLAVDNSCNEQPPVDN